MTNDTISLAKAVKNVYKGIETPFKALYTEIKPLQNSHEAA